MKTVAFVKPEHFEKVAGRHQALFKEMDFVIQEDGMVTACPAPSLETVDQLDRDLEGAELLQAACDAINAWGGKPKTLTLE